MDSNQADSTSQKLYPWLKGTYDSVMSLFVANKLPKVLLLHGPNGSGKSVLASYLANSIITLNKDSDLTDITFNNIQSLKIIAGKSKIKVDEVRELISHAHQTDLNNASKVNIINNIHNLTESAANALLKTLESESSDCYFIMTTNDLSHIKPTILSRCVKVNIPIHHNMDKITVWLAEQGITQNSEQQLLLELVNFGPLAALQAYKDKYITLVDKLESILLESHSDNLVLKTNNILDLFKIASDHDNISLDGDSAKKSSVIKFNINIFLLLAIYILSKNSLQLMKAGSNHLALNLLKANYKLYYQGLTIDEFSLVYKLLSVLNKTYYETV